MVRAFLRVTLLLAFSVSIVEPFYHSVDATVEFLELSNCTTEAINERCLQSSDADRYQVHLLWSRLMYSNSRSLKCYLACMYTNVEFLNHHGEFDGNMIVQENDYITLEEIQLCDDITRFIKDRCEKTFEFSYCLTHTNHTTVK
ncbi:uncharacterized protein LOC116181457 [Photinus pyralis]|uniref:uncharacterized protein LOC116181457 n=1 Tax=Photinus pyralis TaxID=7054 RepID=UPI0012673047|nr:uncharacterized protein LOC116181457 [Photinus pyralis]